MKWGKLLLATALIFGLAACGNAIVDWADFLKLNGKMYSGEQEAVIADPDIVWEKVGEVKFELASSRQKNNSRYNAKDGDAAFLLAGTPVYAVRGFEDGSVVAVIDPHWLNGYKLYRQDRTSTIDRSLSDVTQIQIYRNQNMAVNHGQHVVTLTGGEAKLFIDLVKQAKPGPQPADPVKAERYLVIYEMKNGLGIQQFMAEFEGSYFFTHGESTLPAEIGKFIGTT